MEKITFGRSSDCDIVFDDQLVTRHHGYLLVTGNKVYVVDTNSKNGTFVNGKRIKDKTLLSSRDKVVLAKKFPLDWKKYAGCEDNDETVLMDDETIRSPFTDSGYDSYPSYDKRSGRALIDIPGRMEINQNHAEVYRNGNEGADWKVPFKRNMGDNIGNAVGKTVGCLLSFIIIVAVLALVGLILSNL